MLTTEDLQQLKDVLVPIFDEKLKPIQEDVSGIKQRLDVIEIDVKTMKTDIAHIRKDIDGIVNFFDREHLELRARVERLEERLHLPPYFE